MLAGVYFMKKKDGTPYYKASINYENKHISLGSFPTEKAAHLAYTSAKEILSNTDISLQDYRSFSNYLTFEKWVVLINFRDHHVYIKNPIYLHKNYFSYYLDLHTELKFDIDDLFYYSTHKIQRRQGYLFVADYGMQINILSRYGIHNFSVCGRDYEFVNKDNTDYRYKNIRVINRYYGVTKQVVKGQNRYTASIHINGTFIIGKYKSEEEAAIAYNKAIDTVREAGCKKEFTPNYLVDLSEIEYAKIYHSLRISNKIRELTF
ncbi:MAG: hypothetical protein U0L23_04165 [Lachnospiraceae bacterium]|nr:hypothetical protein [Lachnospiraceae bacterium]